LRESELLQNRLQMVGMIDPYVGRYFSQEYVRNKVLMMTDQEIEEMDKQLEQEKETLPTDEQGPTDLDVGAQPDQLAPQASEDNTYDEKESIENETLTPGLDNEVNKSVVNINNRRKV